MVIHAPPWVLDDPNVANQNVSVCLYDKCSHQWIRISERWCFQSICTSVCPPFIHVVNSCSNSMRWSSWWLWEWRFSHCCELSNFGDEFGRRISQVHVTCAPNQVLTHSSSHARPSQSPKCLGCVLWHLISMDQYITWACSRLHNHIYNLMSLNSLSLPCHKSECG